MRRAITLVMVGGMMLGLAAPAGAAPERYTYESQNANAFWYTTVKPKPGVVKKTEWYVGIYTGSEGTWTDVYKYVTRCERVDGRRRCRVIERIYGDTDLADGSFTMDEGLDRAVLEGTYPLKRWVRGERVPGVIQTYVHVTFEGIGDTQTDSGRSTYTTKCYDSRERWSSANRSAEAYGSVGDVELGETYDAWMGWWESTSTFRTRSGCDEPDHYYG